MNFSCLFILALALFGAFSDAYISPLYSSMGCNNVNGAGYSGGYGGGMFGTAVCDTCQCVKTIARPGFVETVPYGRSRRVHAAPICGNVIGTEGLNGGFVGGLAGGLGAYPETGALGFRSGYRNSGFGFYGGHPCETNVIV